MSVYRATRVLLDSSAILDNVAKFKSWLGDQAFICPMVKANAYGHGVGLVASILARAPIDALGVALVEEGVQLRQLGYNGKILSFSPLTRDSARVCMESRITPVVGRIMDLESLEKTGFAGGWHLKFNTGMQRLGLDRKDIPQLKSWMSRNSQSSLEGVCTHLTHGYEADDLGSFTEQQIRAFDEMSEGLPGIRHYHKTASLLALQDKARGSIGARPGLGIYGLAECTDRNTEHLRPALSWTTQLTHIHDVPKGQHVSYSARWQAPRDSRIGILPVGYGDGLRRRLSGKGQVLIAGQRAPIVGSICMDYTLVDLTEFKSTPAPGSEVILIGRQCADEIRAIDLANWCDTISYEIVTGIQDRVLRVVK